MAVLSLVLATSAWSCEEHEIGTALSVLNVSFNYSKDGEAAFITALGEIQNSSPDRAEDVVVEARYFDAEKKLVDVVTEHIYGFVVPAGQKVAFRVRDLADKPKGAYVTSDVRVVSAHASNATAGRSSKRETPLVLQLLFNAFPILLLIAVWVFFMRRYQGKSSPQMRSLDLIEKQAGTLERQLATLERLANAVESAASHKNDKP
jgi:hypothetical protein